MQPKMAMNAAQHKIINLLRTFFLAHQFLLVFVYLMCSPRQHFFQCGPGTPKGWTPLDTVRLCREGMLLPHLLSSQPCGPSLVSSSHTFVISFDPEKRACHPCYTHEYTEAQRGEVFYFTRGHMAGKWVKWDLNPGFCDSLSSLGSSQWTTLFLHVKRET